MLRSCTPFARIVFWSLAVASCTGSIGTSAGSFEPGEGDSPIASSGGGSSIRPRGGDSAIAPSPGARDPGSVSAPGGPTTSVSPMNPTQCRPTLTPRRIWRLTPSQIANTVETLAPGAVRSIDNLTGTLPEVDGFTNRATVLTLSQPHIEQIFAVADNVAAAVLRDPARAQPCLGSQPGDATCVRAFVQSFGTKAFRRPLGKEEVDDHVAYFGEQARALDASRALGQVIRSMILSPHFLFRTELGPNGGAAGSGPVTLTPFERASALSYFLTDGPPDAALLDAAARGRLDTGEQMAVEARRLLATAASARGLRKFFAEYLNVDDVVSLEKEQALGFKAALASDMLSETRAFVDHVLWEDDARFATLLTAGYSMVNDRLGSFYGVSPTGTSFAKTALPPGERAGLLTQASLLATLAHAKEPDLVIRGKFVRETILCDKVPPPPPDLDPTLPAADRDATTQRERLARHSADPSCSVCHRLLDPIGYALGAFDAIGRYQSTEHGRPIDPRGTIVAAGDGDIAVSDAVALSRVLSTLPKARQCFAGHLYSYGVGLASGKSDACVVKEIAARFEKVQGSIIGTVVAIVSDDSFFLRTF